MISLKQKIELEAIVLVIIVAVASIFFVTYKDTHQPQFTISPNISPMKVPERLIAPKITISSQISPDGTRKVIMKITENADKTTHYDFSTADVDGQNEQHVFTQTLDSSQSMTISFNAWSPDNNYFFVQQNSGDRKNIFVFKTSGAEFAPGKIYLDATDAFKKANTGYNFGEATGWASETLIIINTTKTDNTKGPSYWFEVPDKAIIQLSTEF
jgi:hypothetical protein